jgi:hypothetical protein
MMITHPMREKEAQVSVEGGSPLVDNDSLPEVNGKMYVFM